MFWKKDERDENDFEEQLLFPSKNGLPAKKTEIQFCRIEEFYLRERSHLFACLWRPMHRQKQAG